MALYGEHHRVVRYPLDFSWAVERFLDRVRPDVVGLLELEVWPNFTQACQERGIPVAVLNGRLSAESFGGYRRLRRALSPSFGRLAGVSAQTREYAERFAALGVAPDRIEVADSMKWDVRLPEELAAGSEALGRELGLDPSLPTVVAVSTGPDEEALLLAARPPEVQLVVVPRKPERFDAVAALAPWVRRSLRQGGSRGRGSPGTPDSSGLFLVDTMGEAEAATALGDVVVIGRSFNGMGGSNPVPAARMGRPIVLGPDHHNFADMVEALVQGGAAVVDGDPWTAVRSILGDPDRARAMAEAGPRVVAARSGATEANLALIRRLLPSSDPA
jgi:3-deoxy-D-manno-octulosonic-acid transferase